MSNRQESIGGRIKALRTKQQGLTQDALAERIEVSRQAMAFMEQGRQKPSRDTVVSLAIALDTSADYLLGLTDDPRPLRELVRLAEGQGPTYLPEARMEIGQILSLAQSLSSRLGVPAGYPTGSATSGSSPAGIGEALRRLREGSHGHGIAPSVADDEGCAG